MNKKAILLVGKHDLDVHLSATNWTFGFWWGRIGRYVRIGVDLGPLELVGSLNVR